MDATKYQTGYYPAPRCDWQWTQRDHIEKAPVWCSVDLRDGNQSLVVPMDLGEKLVFYRKLVQIGFKEIEVGFPAASETEYAFLRTLIDRKLIPEDVTVQVLTQCREHIIRRTFEACRGVGTAIIHFYNAISAVQREQVYGMSRAGIRQVAVDAARLVKKLAGEYDGHFRFEYSPESFTGAEPEFALEVCNAVLDELQPGENNNVIINLPVTVEMSMPHIYASQVEYISQNLKYRDHVTLSVHPHNDRGTGVADTELALLAGAQRVEGTLFGNGERTGNVDIVTLALNLYTHGVDPRLDLSDINDLVETYETCTRMHVHERTPYAGSLVFAAFSGGHQDAIAKSFRYREEKNMYRWNVPYLPIDPGDIGRTYDADVIRVNSQSGKGGIGYVLEHGFGYHLPPKMREAFSYRCKEISDRTQRELKPGDVLDIFAENYLNVPGDISVTDFAFDREKGVVRTRVTFLKDGKETQIRAEGNGSLSAVSNALMNYTGEQFTLHTFSQHSLAGHGSGSAAVSYIGLQTPAKKVFWGAGTDTDVIRSSIHALLSAYHNMMIGRR